MMNLTINMKMLFNLLTSIISEACPAGKYRRQGMNICAKCESDTNSISENSGAEMCATCPAGTVANEDRTKCGK